MKANDSEVSAVPVCFGNYSKDFSIYNLKNLWCRGVVVITTAQLHSTKPEPRLYAGSNPARGVSEIPDGEDL